MKQIVQDIYAAGPKPDTATLTEVALTVGGYTLIDTDGGWIDPNGRLFEGAGWILRTVQEGTWLSDAVVEAIEGWCRANGEQAVLVTRRLETVRMVTL